ncbi:flagellar hook-associated protein FlgL [Rugamonas sp.]|uniref:flagellar hook-associated protein FlgL n=1 Tax=Rugamonas sp. TaxID=1926287 RepID=UPI0025E2F56A|nr:flagellar hook-associated protein FlgL [Rugamonas sp.]
MSMRISSQTIFDIGVKQIGSLNSAIAHTQQQLSTGNKNLTASDDPIAAARALEVTQSAGINTQLMTNRQSANSSLSQEDVALSSTMTLIQDVMTLATNAGDGALSQADRGSLATALQGKLNDLLGQANTADGVGGYLFSGYSSNTVPFSLNATGADYAGDQGQRSLQIGSTRSIPVSDSGSSVFENNATGNGTFLTGADPGNYGRGGTGIISAGSVTSPAALTGNDYEIDFAVVPPAGPGSVATSTYTILNKTTGLNVPPAPVPAVGIPYTTGTPISFDGLTFNVQGAPADGDKFTVVPSTKQSIFTTVTSLITALQAPGSGPAGQASLSNALNQANLALNNAHDNILTVRASVGSRMNELDYLDSSGGDLDVAYKTTLSGLQDVDPVKAISDFTQQQTTLDAAQKSFKTLSGLSLFNYIT